MHYFDVLQTAFLKYKQFSDDEDLQPNCIYAMDLQPCQNQGYVLTKKGSTNVYSVSSENRNHVTVIAFTGSNGISGDPFFVVPKGEKKNFHVEKLGECPVEETSSAYINDKVYIQWCEHFVKQIGSLRGDPSKWVLLVVDSHICHTMNPKTLVFSTKLIIYFQFRYLHIQVLTFRCMMSLYLDH